MGLAPELVSPLFSEILMGVRLIPGRRQSKIVALGGILALVLTCPGSSDHG